MSTRCVMRAATWFLPLALCGCVGGQRIETPTTQPVDIDALSGQIAAKIEADVRAEIAGIKTTIGEVRGDVAAVKTDVGYSSQFGPGAVIAAIVPSIVLCIILLAALRWSHAREQARIQRGV